MSQLVLLLASVLVCAGTVHAGSLKLRVDPGAAGTRFSHQTLRFVGALNGTALDGQTQSVDILFSDKKFAVAGELRIDLHISQSGDLGTVPATYFVVTGSLLDAAGNALGAPVDFRPVMTMPAQVWPGWGYYLPDGKEYVPATTGYEADFSGRPFNMDKWNNYSIDPIVFSGVHFDITCPDTPKYSVKGLSVAFSDFKSQIYISPEPMPKFKGQKKKEVMQKRPDRKNKSNK